MNWSLAFEPLLSWPLLAAVLVPVAAAGARRPVVPPARRIFRFAAFVALGAGAAQSGAARRGARAAEERRGAGRRPQPEPGHRRPHRRNDRGARRRCRQRLARFKQFDVRVVEAGKAEAAEDDRTETRLFGALESAFRDVPPSRIAGAIMVTDGQVHDVPGSARRLQCAAACADHRRRGREGPPHPLRATRRASASSASRST